jgi:hypothetical protein
MTPLATFLRTLHQALFRRPFLVRLIIGSLPPTRPPKQEQKISDNSPGIIYTIPMHRLELSLWKLAPLVELKWQSYSTRLIFEAVP